MDVREVSVEYSRTVNLGDYESERVQVGLVSMVAEGENHRRLVEELALEAEDAALKQLARLAGQRRDQRRREYRIPDDPLAEQRDEP